MAEAAGIRAALVRLGFAQPSADYITNDQGLDMLSELAILTDDEIQSLVKVIRRPGGTINNPAVTAPYRADAAAIAIAAAAPDLIPNPGLTVSLRAENNLKLMCYLLSFKERTSTPVTLPEITLIAVRNLKGEREMEDDHKDVEAPVIDSKDWPHTIDAIEEWLRGFL